MTPLEGVTIAVATAAAAVSGIRWLRVAQREHYLAGSVIRFQLRWLRAHAVNTVAAALTLASVVAAAAGWLPVIAATVIVAAYAALLPVGMPLRGRTAPLRWTDRLTRVAVGGGIFWAIVVAAGWWLPIVPVASVLVVPAILDLVLGVLAPLEHRMGDRWVRQAAARIAATAPRVVAITGSYGKTTTKEYVRLLLAPHLVTVASPASFNNRMGLARAVNEQLSDATEVFVAEMGTYGPGEIADLVKWIPPDVGVITAIGPVHLERFKSLDTTLAAKSEILQSARVAVLNIDDPRLDALASRITESPNRELITVSASGTDATVSLVPIEGGYRVNVNGRSVANVAPVPFPTNFACAIGVAVALDLPLSGIDQVVARLAPPSHRQTVHRSEQGFWIIDDTYNSNPAGVEAALAKLAGLTASTRVVVTPGMVELGPEQAESNRSFAQAAGAVADAIVVVGRTNRRALLEGAARGGASVILKPSRTEAVEWVRANLPPDGAVLYENDLPDHYP